MLGLLFQEGWGTARDAVSAERWFSAAASQHYDDVWLPLGLFYAETGRIGEARAAFDAAVRLNAYSFARDTGILQLVFIESEKMPEPGGSLLPDEAKPLSGEEAKEERRHRTGRKTGRRMALFCGGSAFGGRRGV